MKSFYIFAFAFSLTFFSCTPPDEKNNEPLTSVTKAKLNDYQDEHPPAPSSDSKLIGKWQVDSSGFIDNDVKKPLEAPLADAFWEFTSDGRLIVSGNASFSCDIHVVNNEFKVTMGGIDMDYRIDKLTDNELVLLSTIVETKEMKMVSVAKLKRVRK